MIAYLILAHRNLHQVTRLVERLVSERATFFIHIDKKTDIASYEPKWRSLPRVQMAERRHICPWGEFGLVEATLGLMAAALRHRSIQRLTLLSGQDYPIKPRRQIEDFSLGSHATQSFVEHFRLPRSDWAGDGGMGRIQNWHVPIGGRVRSLGNFRLGLRRSLPYGLSPYQGGQCWSLSRECADFVLEYVADHPRLVRFYRRSLCADESFFQTVLMNSPLSARVENSDLRFERWEADSSHPEVLTMADLPAIAASPALFAKKFDTDVDSAVLDRIDWELLG
jgi:hypothetical protein